MWFNPSHARERAVFVASGASPGGRPDPEPEKLAQAPQGPGRGSAARELPDGKLMLDDGHLRAETTPDSEVPVLVLDVTAEEADKILLTLDPLAGMATADSEAVKALVAGVKTDSDAVKALLERVGKDTGVLSDGTPLTDPPAQIDKAAELKAKWGTETGQLWQDRAAPVAMWGLPARAGRRAAVAGRRAVSDGLDRSTLLGGP